MFTDKKTKEYYQFVIKNLFYKPSWHAHASAEQARLEFFSSLK